MPHVTRLSSLLLLLLLLCESFVYALSMHFGLTVPGTKWCGPGNTADNYDDLGSAEETDMCCRAHDHCKTAIKAKSTNYSLKNDEWFPIFSCRCETEFRECLQAVNNMESNALGRIYFSSRGRCFDFGYPNIGCNHYQWEVFRQRCLNYKTNPAQAKQWQFYDLAFYTIKNDEDSDVDLDDK